VSSILNRLREVEGAASPHHTRAVGGQQAPSGALTEDRKENGWKTGRKAAACRVLAGVLVASAVFLVWRAWKGEAPVGKTLTQSGKRMAAAPQKEPLRAPVRATANEEQRPVASPASEGSGANSSEDVFAATGPKNAEVTVPSEKPALGSGQALSGGQLPEKGAVVPSPTAPQTGNTLTAEEDERTKGILRKLKVTGVFRDASGYLAFINGRELQQGDKIEHIEIAEIASERITFAFRGKRYILRLR
jgi:hypothetical protein